MRNRMVALVVTTLVVLGALSLAGCGGNSTKSSTSGTSEPSSSYTGWSSTGMEALDNSYREIQQILSLANDSKHNLLYAGTDGYGVYKYDGTTWTDTSGGVSKYDIDSLANDSTHNLLYAGTGKNGVWKYDGTTWTDTGGTVSSYGIPSLTYDSTHSLLYAGTGKNGVWKYDGTTWTDTNTSGGVSSSINSLAYDSVNNLLYAGLNSGVWKYDGTNWTDTGGEVSGVAVKSLVCDSVHNRLYAGGGEVYVYDGTTWTWDSPKDVLSLAYDSTHNLLYAGCAGGTGYKGVWKYDGTNRTDTGGPSPSDTNSTVVYGISSLTYDSTHNLLYAGTDHFGPDGGGVWRYGSQQSPKPTGKPNTGDSNQ